MFILPSDILVSLFCDWFDFPSLVQFDAACLNRVSRNDFLSVIDSKEFVFSQDVTLTSASAIWLSLRDVKVSTVNINVCTLELLSVFFRKQRMTLKNASFDGFMSSFGSVLPSLLSRCEKLSKLSVFYNVGCDFSAFGSKITAITLNTVGSLYVGGALIHIGLHCPNLMTMTIKANDLPFPYLNNLPKNATYYKLLEHLEIGQNVTEDDVRYLTANTSKLHTISSGIDITNVLYKHRKTIKNVKVGWVPEGDKFIKFLSNNLTLASFRASSTMPTACYQALGTCTNLQVLSCECCPDAAASVSKMSNLTSFSNYYGGVGFGDVVVRSLIDNCPLLTKLNLMYVSCDEKLLLEFFQKRPKLRYFSVSGVSSLIVDTLANCCPQLEVFMVARSASIRETAIQSLVKSCDRLSVLRLATVPVSMWCVTQIAMFGSCLKVLSVNGKNLSDTAESILTYGCPQLRNLSIVGGCKSVNKRMKVKISYYLSHFVDE